MINDAKSIPKLTSSMTYSSSFSASATTQFFMRAGESILLVCRLFSSHRIIVKTFFFLLVPTKWRRERDAQIDRFDNIIFHFFCLLSGSSTDKRGDKCGYTKIFRPPALVCAREESRRLTIAQPAPGSINCLERNRFSSDDILFCERNICYLKCTHSSGEREQACLHCNLFV